MEQENFRDGISFARGMQLLSGVGIEKQDDLALSHDRREWLEVNVGQWLEKILSDLRTPENIGDADPGELLKTTLRPYQQTGVNWLWFMTRLGLGSCLADDMGLGKTIQILALLLLMQKEQPSRESSTTPSLLVVPASLMSNWKSEIGRFAPSLTVFLAHPSETPSADLASLSDPDARKKQLGGKDLVITTYALLHRQKWLEETQWSLIVLDEAQSIKNPSTRQTRAVGLSDEIQANL